MTGELREARRQITCDPRATHDHPDVLAVCRWLPQPYPSGAFTGRHDRIHVGDRQGLAALWWSELPVHQGEYVGPPRGGLAPEPTPSYDVAMPPGGFLHIAHGVVSGWSDEPESGLIIRADGDSLDPTDHESVQPYFLDQYRALSPAQCEAALAQVARRRLPRFAGPRSPQREDRVPVDVLVTALQDRIATARPPVICRCDVPGAEPPRWPRPRGGHIPAALLRHGGAIATLAGLGTADDAVDVVWRLTRELADPTRAGLVRAAESAARRSADSMSGWPDAPLTEEAVALVAAQAVRWHGSSAVSGLPFWTLGWIFLARPVLDRLVSHVAEPDRIAVLAAAMDRADEVRVNRAERMWAAANEAAGALVEIARIAAANEPLHPIDVLPLIDLRDSRRSRPSVHVPEPRPPADNLAYDSDVATVVATLVGN